MSMISPRKMTFPRTVSVDVDVVATVEVPVDLSDVAAQMDTADVVRLADRHGLVAISREELDEVGERLRHRDFEGALLLLDSLLPFRLRGFTHALGAERARQ